MECKKCGLEFTPSKGLKNYCSLECRNSRVWTQDDKKLKSTSAKNSLRVRQANIDIGKKRLKTPTITTCLKCGKDIISYKRRNNKYHSECWLVSSGGFRKNSTIKYSSYYKGYKMDSNSEREFAILCDKNNINWRKNIGEEYYEYLGSDGKNHKYYPDFYLLDFDYWVEIKGKLYADKDPNLSIKLSSVPRIKILYSKELRKIDFKKFIDSLYY
jgi:hypothetical protein